jgi:hypothetical protein
VINTQEGDQIKAEILAREGHRITIKLFGSDHHEVGYSGNLLSTILLSQGKLGDETKRLHECCLANTIRYKGLDGSFAGNTFSYHE